MHKILILFAHPKYEISLANKALLEVAADLPFVTINDLYEKYPFFNIDVPHEHTLMEAHDIIIWQHPIYWYAAPALLKQWMDLVLTHGWAYGTGGNALKGKYIFNAVTTSGSAEAYSPNGLHKRPLKEYLLPYLQTAELCNMVYLPHFQVKEAHHLTKETLQIAATKYRELLEYLHTSDADFSKLQTAENLCNISLI